MVHTVKSNTVVLPVVLILPLIAPASGAILLRGAEKGVCCDMQVAEILHGIGGRMLQGILLNAGLTGAELHDALQESVKQSGAAPSKLQFISYLMRPGMRADLACECKAGVF